jgi:hypothetical protein
MASRTISVEIVGDATSLKRAFDKAGDSSRSLGSKLASVGKVAAVGLAAGFGVAAVVMKKSVDAALEAEKAQTRLDAAFKAANVTAEQRAKAMQNVSKVSVQAALDDEDLMDTLGRLTRVTGSAEKAQRDMAIAANLARGRGIELSAATQIVTKAELGNVGALKRIGIEIPKVTAAQDALKASHDKATDAQVKAAKAADDTATRQSAIAALQKQYAGAAEAYGNSAAGAQDRFKVAVENLQESLGGRLLPVIAQVAEGASKFITRISEADGASAKFKVAMDVLKTGAQDAVKVIQDKLGKIDWGKVGAAMGAGVTAAANRLAAAIQNADFEKAGAVAAKGFVDGWKNAVRNIDWSALAAAVGRLLFAALTLQSRLLFGAAKVLGAQIIRGVQEGLTGVKNAVTAKLDAARDAVVNAAKYAYGNALGIGKAIVSGVVDGLTGLFQAVVGKITGGIDGAIAYAKKHYKIGSPSKVFADEIGKPLAEGLGMGFIDGMRKVNNQMTRELNVMQNQLTAITNRRAAEDRAAAVRDAEAALVQARKKKEGVVAAEQALARAREDIVVAGIEKSIAREQAALDKRQALVQTKMDKLNAAIQKAQDKQAAILDKARDKILRAFDAVRGNIKTPAEAALEALTNSRTQRDLQKALTDALQSGDQEAILRAREDIQRDSLERQAQTERTALDNQTDALRESLSEKLEVWKGGTAAILKLLQGYGIDFQSVGALLGSAFRDSMIASIKGQMAPALAPVGGGGGQRAMAAASSGSGTQTINLMLDGKAIASVVRNENTLYQSRGGTAFKAV